MVLFFDGFLYPDHFSTAVSAVVSKTWFPDIDELEKGLVESGVS
jgi:hypothetical protein